MDTQVFPAQYFVGSAWLERKVLDQILGNENMRLVLVCEQVVLR